MQLIVSQTLFKGKKYLVNHMKKSHGNDAFETDKLIERTCTQCQKEFTNKSVLARHIKTVHEQERPFKCDHCLKHFFNNNQLQVKSLPIYNSCSELFLLVEHRIFTFGQAQSCNFKKKKNLLKRYIRLVFITSSLPVLLIYVN